MPRLLRKITRAARHQEFTWRYAFNLAPSLAYRFHHRPLSGEAARVIETLNRDGMAVTSAQALLGADSLYDELEAAVGESERELAEELAGQRLNSNDVSSLGTKTFIRQLLGSNPEFDPRSIYFRFALQQQTLDIVNAYFGMYTRLREYNVWHTFVTSVQARESQLWHRDREDLLILKMFVYMNDIDEGAGPFTYAPGTHLKGAIHKLPESYDENGVRRSTDEQMAKVVPPSKWVKAMGAKGTIIFADTHGYHKGGHATKRDRIMYTSMFTSPASESRELMARPPRPIRFPDQARMVALAAQRRGLWLTLPK